MIFHSHDFQPSHLKLRIVGQIMNGSNLFAIPARGVIKENPPKFIDVPNHGAKLLSRDPMTYRGIVSVLPYTNARIKIAQHAVRDVGKNSLDLMLGDAMNLRVPVESGKSIENLRIH